jgi:hypothetical protein
MSVVAAVGVLCSSAAFAQEKISPPQVTEKARLVLPADIKWQS